MQHQIGVSWLTASRAGSWSLPLSVTFSSLEAGRFRRHWTGRLPLLLWFCRTFRNFNGVWTSWDELSVKRSSVLPAETGETGPQLWPHWLFWVDAACSESRRPAQRKRREIWNHPVFLLVGWLVDFLSYLLDAVVCDVHQLVPLPGHSPDISLEHNVLHWEDAEVLDLQRQDVDKNTENWCRGASWGVILWGTWTSTVNRRGSILHISNVINSGNSPTFIRRWDELT